MRISALNRTQNCTTTGSSKPASAEGVQLTQARGVEVSGPELPTFQEGRTIQQHAVSPRFLFTLTRQRLH